MDVPNRIMQLTKERGWSEYRLVKESHLAASTISNIFHRNTVPSIATLESICDAFGITLCQFFSDNEMIPLSSEQARFLKEWGAISSEQRSLIQKLMRTMAK